LLFKGTFDFVSQQLDYFAKVSLNGKDLCIL